MKLHWNTATLLGFTFDLLVLLVSAAEVQYVQFGSTVTLSCNMSYIYETTWLKQNAEDTPTVVLSAVLREGQPDHGFQLESRYTVTLRDRSLALRITAIQEEDLGFFYCIGKGNTDLMIGTGTMLQNEHVPQFLLQHWYCVLVGVVLLIMVLAVCITHWRIRSGTVPQPTPRQIHNQTTPPAAEALTSTFTRLCV